MLERGDKIGDYTLVRFLGRGQFGEVWLAEKQLQFSKKKFQHALKFLFNLGDEINLKSAEAEIDTWMEASGHPNVMSVLDMLVHNDHIVIASEFAEGGSLKGWLSQGGGRAPSHEKALEMMTGILSGIEHLHSRNVVHRDLKPDNILLQGNFPRITDFGISRIISAGSMSTVAMGSPFYMSPESFDGSKSTQTDIWSAGVILYEMLTGEHPYRSETIYGLVSAIRQAEPKPLPEFIPGGLRTVIENALQKDLAKRYQTAQEMREAVELEIYDIKVAHKSMSGTADDIRLAPTVTDAGATLVNEYFNKSLNTEPRIPDAPPKPDVDARQAVTEVYNVADSLKGTPAEVYLKRDDELSAGRASGSQEVPSQSPAIPVASEPAVPSSPASAVRRFMAAVEEESSPNMPSASIPPQPAAVAEAPAGDRSGSQQFENSQFSQTKKPLVLIGGIGGAIVIGVILSLVAIVTLVLVARSMLNKATEVAASNTASPAANVRQQPAAPVAPPGMAYIDGGTFTMGRNSGEIPEEQPAHSVTVEPFFMDINEVTNEEYAEFVKASGHKPPQGWRGGAYPPGEAHYPVVGVSWKDAVDFATYKAKRLPTEEEWEFAARGRENLLYPWGNEWMPRLANVDGVNKTFTEVGQYPGKSPYGMYDMVGNAGEWTSNDFKAYPGGHVSDGSAPKGDLKTRRGCDYSVGRAYATTTFRYGYPATGADYSFTGFRCAQDAGK